MIHSISDVGFSRFFFLVELLFGTLIVFERRTNILLQAFKTFQY